MRNIFRTVSTLLLALLGGCAAGVNLHAANETATDEAPDRILVTVEADSLAGIADLSHSGRLDYLPPAPEQIRQAQRQRAQAIVASMGDAFDLRLEEDWPIPALDVYCFVFRMDEPDGERRNRIIASLAKHPDVESVQPLNFFHTRNDAGRGDPLSSVEAMPGRTGRLYQQASGRSVTVAIIDAGADLQHEDLAGADVTAFDLVENNAAVPAEHHGTAVLGVIAARRGNGKGIGGYAPDARILLLRACWQPSPSNEQAMCNSFTLAKALSYALDSDADIVNLSVAGPRDPLLERLAALLDDRDKLLVAAGESRKVFPASVADSVMAAKLLPAAEHGVMTLLPGDRYGVRRGSSLQAARITGIATLIRELAPGIGATELHQRLVRLRTESIDTAFADLLKAEPADRTTKVSTAR